MSLPKLPQLPKWPFILGDALLLALAAWLVHSQPGPLGPWALGALVVCVLAGAWVCATPFLVQYRAAIRFAESTALTSTVQQMAKLNELAALVGRATSQWQGVQEYADRTIKAAREIAERMTTEAQSFSEFLAKANDGEKAHLRLEVDKLRRTEGDWLQTLVGLLDHVYALHQAGVRSGQRNLQEQLGLFQKACRETVRRLGLIPFEAAEDDVFDDQQHQLADQSQPPAGARITETLATGYMYQGQLLRRALVRLKDPAASEIDAEPQMVVDQGA